ncbi:MAG: peptidoglycan-binding protein, partial [Acutalibacteraceae bacterium]
IPVIPETDGIYGKQTENAVKAFQQIFNLEPDGIVGEATWYTIKRIYNAVKRLSELYSEGITISEAQREYPYQLQKGSTGVYVRIIQYFLDFISYFNSSLPHLKYDGIFGSQTEQAVKIFQQENGLPVTGIVDRATWNEILNEYDNILKSLPYEFQSYSAFLFPGYTLVEGAEGKAVEQLQTFLQVISQNLSSVPYVAVDGIYGPQTENAVKVIQGLYGIPQTGDVGPLTWNAIVELYNDFRTF